ncbi:uncharacterized protein LOC128551430, partial [Mercenaria mercenaria]|uniref:uncharacterized protein LOC128551430 n=1 Tax=Mercenaria mercenaria TaxID=6596 RepID=UPI00234EF841
MSDNPEESAYFLRLMSMYMDLCTESVRNVFNFHSPDNNGEKFLLLHVNQAKLIELKREKVLNQQESELVITQWPNLKRMDISLLITLSINLFTTVQLSPPIKGWNRPPKGTDISIAADLLRLKKIRNTIVGHYPCARLAQWRFEEEWETIKIILLRIEKHISPGNEEHLQIKIDQYLIQELQPGIKGEHDPKLREWYQEVFKAQEQVDKYLEKLEGFSVYLKSKSNRYERYIKLLVKGGQFVLSALLKAKCQPRDLRSILDEKEHLLKEKITDPKHLEVIYSSDSDRLSNALDLSKWDISLLAGVLLYAFECSDDMKKAIGNIYNARRNYAETAVIALDPDSFVEHVSDLKTSIIVASNYLNAEEKTQIEEILEECKKTSMEDGSFKIYMNELKSQGLQMKTFSDIHKETVKKTKTYLQEMITSGISFNNSRVLELKMITVGSGEEKKEIAENILFEVWQTALDITEDKNDFQEIKKEVIKILEEIKKKKSVHNVDVKQECILLQMSCRQPCDILALIEYFDSVLFRKYLDDICKEVGYYCDTIVAICAHVTIESLDSILNTPIRQEKQETGVRVPITVSSPAAMVELRKFFRSGKFINGTNAIAEELSKHTNSEVELKSFIDMKELNDVFDGDTDDESSDSSSTTDTIQPMKTGSYWPDLLEDPFDYLSPYDKRMTVMVDEVRSSSPAESEKTKDDGSGDSSSTTDTNRPMKTGSDWPDLLEDPVDYLSLYEKRM